MAGRRSRLCAGWSYRARGLAGAGWTAERTRHQRQTAIGGGMGSRSRRGLTAAEWGVLVLLVTSVFINYVDRSNLSIAAPLLESELSLTPSRLGALLAAFFWTYALLQLFGIAGWL